MTREIVTLQIGHYSNTVGAHLWNHLDVEQRNENTLIDYNAYYTVNKKTNIPSPRVLIIDYRNTFGYLFNENETNLNADNSSIEIINRPIENNFWSNNLKSKAKFSPKSLLPLTDYWYSVNEEENQFDIYPIGQQVYKKMFDQIENSLHFLLESCDSLQSFRCLYDANNSYSGLFTSIQDHLNDECPKRPLWSFGLSDKPPSSPQLNLSLALTHSLNENQMPTISCLNQPDSLQLALAIQHSLFSSTLTLDILADRLCPMKKNFLNLYKQCPLDLNRKTLFNYLEMNNLFELNNPIAGHCFIRGVEQNQLYNHSLYNFNISTSGDLISTYLREQYGSKMFLSTNSWIEKLNGYSLNKDYDHVALLTGLINEENYCEKFFGDLLKEMKKMKFKLLSQRWQENDFDEQMFEQLINELNILHERYQLNKYE